MLLSAPHRLRFSIFGRLIYTSNCRKEREVSMPADKWNEEGKVWEADHGLLDEGQVAQCARADEHDPFRSPIPTRMFSTGGDLPVPHTPRHNPAQPPLPPPT